MEFSQSQNVTLPFRDQPGENRCKKRQDCCSGGKSIGVIKIGTSGYHFLDWKEVFYPSDLQKSEWLRYYSTHFKALEVNTSYYGVPKVETVQRWSDETPEDFDFIVKVHGDTTHKREGKGEEIHELMESLSPLSKAGKLKGLLAQFPASFHFNEESKKYLETLADYGKDVSIFTEFRHSSWDCEEAVKFIRENRFGWVVVDLPPIKSLPGIRPTSTISKGYVRFHGRNATTWYNQDKGNRYDWNYEAEYLKKWIIRLKAITGYAEMTYLFFNNCHAGQAVKNALLMREILSQEFKIVS